MNNPKVWAVLGAMDGLGNAAIKYLVANKQIVIAFIKHDIPANLPFDQATKNFYRIPVESFLGINLKNALKDVITTYGAIDFIINNSNYGLFDGPVRKTSGEIQSSIHTDISVTIKLIKAIIPYLRKEPRGSLINIPPQLCLATVPDKTDAELLTFAMESFLKTLEAELQLLDCGLSFLRPGERLANFTI